MSITVVIPTIEGRFESLQRAIRSAKAQTLPPADVVVALDEHRVGAAATRNRALQHITTEWVAFLDDDDELLPNHLRACARFARLSGVDVVYPGYVTDDDPIGCFGLEFDATLLRRRNFIPVTTLCRTAAVKAAGGFQDHPDENGDPCEDWGLWLAMVDAGFTFAHLPQRTWIWHVNGGARAVARD